MPEKETLVHELARFIVKAFYNDISDAAKKE